MRTPRTITAIAAAGLILAACGSNDEDLDAIDVGAGTTQQDGAGTEETTQATEEGAGEAASTDGDATDAPETDVVDRTEAVPGTWPVGDAGTVTFAIVDGALVLDDVATADGWRSDIDEQDPDEIEVDFTRDNEEWEIEIELEDDGRTLEIEIDRDVRPAEPGSYDLGDAGTFAFSVTDGRLVLDDRSVADDWTVTEIDEEADEIEFELVNGPRQYDVEVELEDDGTIDLEIDYEVTGPVDG